MPRRLGHILTFTDGEKKKGAVSGGTSMERRTKTFRKGQGTWVSKALKLVGLDMRVKRDGKKMSTHVSLGSPESGGKDDAQSQA